MALVPLGVADELARARARRRRVGVLGAVALVAASVLAVVSLRPRPDGGRPNVTELPEPSTVTSPSPGTTPGATDPPTTAPPATVPETPPPAASSPFWQQLPDGPLGRRSFPFVVAAGHELVVLGGQSSLTASAPRLTDGAIYSPSSSSWRAMAPAPFAPSSATWTGSELLVVGNDGSTAGYDPASDVWRTLASSRLSPRDLAATAWTGRELLVWGGSQPDCGVSVDCLRTQFPTDGAAYRPSADSWRALPDTGGVRPAGGGRVVSGRWVVPTGRAEPGLPITTSAAWSIYDPKADSWRTLPTPAGTHRGGCRRDRR